MNITVHIEQNDYRADLSLPLDISLSAVGIEGQGRAFFLPPTAEVPFAAGTFIGSVEQGGACNCTIITVAPHGAGTHTECVGHISQGKHSINSMLRCFHFPAYLMSVEPELRPNGDYIITKKSLENALANAPSTPALVLRTLPNTPDKQHRIYSGANPAYLATEAMEYIVQREIYHLLLDLPSVDREEDGGMLSAHRIFWCGDNPERERATITEMIYVDESIPDGLYLLNLQIAPLESDATPSKPVLYTLQQCN